MVSTSEDVVTFDKILDKIGNLGKYQLLHISFLYFTCVPCGLLSLANVFYAAVPKYWCLKHHNKSFSGNVSVSFQKYSSGYSDGYIFGINGTANFEESCSHWIFDKSVYVSTIVSEWEFICSKEWLASLSQTTYMCGIFIGGFVGGNVGDRFGRKKTSLLGLLIMSASGTIAAFIPNYWAFIAVRLVSAVGNTMTGINGFVHIMEILATKYRMHIGMYYQFPFALGYILLSGVAYFLRDFRHLQLFVGLYPLLPVPLFFFIDESPRWLMTKGRFDEARSIVKKMCFKNGVDYPEDLMEKETAILKEKKSVKGNTETSKSSHGIFYVMRYPRLRLRMMTIAYGWILCSLTYYGLSQASSDLVGDPRFNLFLSGLTEFPGILFCSWLLDKIGRKWTLSGVFFLSGACVAFVPAVLNNFEIITTVLSMTGKMAISGAFAIVYLYTAELFPTVIRSLTVGTGSMASRIGSILSPNIILLSKVWVGFPFIIFGSLTLLGGFITLILPETLHQPLLETVEESEKFGKSACENICEFPCINSREKEKQELEETNKEDITDVVQTNL